MQQGSFGHRARVAFEFDSVVTLFLVKPVKMAHRGFVIRK
jgi:hypothetical protein